MENTWKTREVLVGSVGVGGKNPVRIQSMTTSDTKDIKATADQIMRLSDVGCEIARVTVQGKKEAFACEGIKNLLVQKGYEIPLVADIHFYPPAAMIVADFVDKVRINPGNFADRRATFKEVHLEDADYQKELERIEEKFAPLVLKCQKLKKAIRIGSNHGSLSDRIMSLHGDSPKGMVESALEFAQICRKYDFHDVIFSMKSSNPKIMIEAYRLLVKKMQEMGWDYPLHLGVTEAGNGADGRIKSSVGIGSLLLDGIGDTIRVSLTEDPWYEIPACQKLASLAPRFEKVIRPELPPNDETLNTETKFFVMVSTQDVLSENFYEDLGFKVQFDLPQNQIASVDGVILKEDAQKELAIKKLKAIKDLGKKVYFLSSINSKEKYQLLGFEEISQADTAFKDLKKAPTLLEVSPSDFEPKKRDNFNLKNQNSNRVVLYQNLFCDESSIVESSAVIGKIILDDQLESFALSFEKATLKEIVNLGLSILQACRKKLVKTEYIACPGCGRTLFNLQDVTEKIKAATSHLPGVKIAVMGCIVNGPGEMADADFGYVGSKTGYIDLYVGKTCVKRSVLEKDAVDELILLIKEHGKWIEKPSSEIATLKSL